MAYQALLFCPEEKTARTVTQVLSELEFNVEPCTEPFAAVKKLMSQHFDAIVVDCDNEQNATLMFKSARNSTSNQASLAVAIVEGQAGVAKAFRIGANLVLTKPINVEQSKGTLRVARGLLRKGEPVKPAASGTTVQAIPAAPTKPAPPAVSVPVIPAATPKTAAPKPVPPIKTELPIAPVTTAAPRTAAPPVVKPTAMPAPARAAAAPAAKTAPVAKIEAPASKTVGLPTAVAPAQPAVPPPAASKTPAAPQAPAKTPEVTPVAHVAKPTVAIAPESPAGTFGGGAASAPAPAREVQPPQAADPASEKSHHAAEDLFEQPAAATETTPANSDAPAVETPPSFTFGGANTPEPSTGAGKKILLVAAMMLVVVGVYLAWNYFQGRTSQPASPATAATPVSNPVQPSVSQSVTSSAKPAAAVPSNTQPATNPAAVGVKTSLNSDSKETDREDSSSSISSPSKPLNSAPAPEKNVTSTKPEAAPLVVKGGSAPAISHKTAATTDSSAPSVIGIASTGSDGALSDIAGGNKKAPQPVLQTLNISQGVSQGLVLKRVQPIYPKNAITMHIEGAVELLATISKTGSISSVKVLKGDSQLSRAAVEAVKQWKYKPYLLNGEPVEIQTQVTVNFKLPH